MSQVKRMDEEIRKAQSCENDGWMVVAMYRKDGKVYCEIGGDGLPLDFIDAPHWGKADRALRRSKLDPAHCFSHVGNLILKTLRDTCKRTKTRIAESN